PAGRRVPRHAGELCAVLGDDGGVGPELLRARQAPQMARGGAGRDVAGRDRHRLVLLALTRRRRAGAPGTGAGPDGPPLGKDAGALGIAPAPAPHPGLQLLAPLGEPLLAGRVGPAAPAGRAPRPEVAEVPVGLELVPELARDELDHDRVVEEP